MSKCFLATYYDAYNVAYKHLCDTAAKTTEAANKDLRILCSTNILRQIGRSYAYFIKQHCH